MKPRFMIMQGPSGDIAVNTNLVLALSPHKFGGEHFDRAGCEVHLTDRVRVYVFGTPVTVAKAIDELWGL